jgi:hypothetical protein
VRLPAWHVSVVVVMLIFLGATRMAAAVEVSGRSSTQYIWFNDIVDGSYRADLAEYLRISFDKIDDAGNFSVKGYGRALYDAKNGGDGEARLYYLFADFKNLLDTADVRLGRQFVNLSAGSALVDGLQADVKNIGPVGFTVVGGRDVLFDETGQLSSHVYSAGAAAYLTGIKSTDFDISYYRVYDYSDIARDTIGSNFKQYLFDSVKLYANARYDLTAEVLNESLAGIQYFPTLNLMLTAEYFESYPTFDSTSIYSVFAVDKYKEDTVRADYTVLAWLDISAGYNHEDFDEGGAADTYELGLKLRPSIKTTVGLYHDTRYGYGGNLNGYKVYAEYTEFTKWKAAGGMDYDVYERDDLTGNATAKKYWVAGRYLFTRKMSGSLRMEDNVNINYSKDIQGRVTFDYDF